MTGRPFLVERRSLIPIFVDWLRRICGETLCAVFVATGPDAEAVVGYYTLSAAHFRREALPADQAKRLPVLSGSRSAAGTPRCR